MHSLEELFSTYSENDIYHAIYKDLGYKEYVPTIDEFIESDEYLGLITNNGNGIYDYWREQLRKIYPTPFTSPYHTIMLRGSIGTGKSVMGKIISLYNICKMMKLDYPREQFKLLPTVSLEFFIYAADLSLINAVATNELVTWINTSEYFKTRLNNGTQSHRGLFVDNMTLTVGSTIRHNVGRAIFSALFEEIQQERMGSQLEDNYNSILARIKSRFITENGVFGQIVLVGSAGDDNSFSEVLTEKSRDDPGILIIEPAQWEVLSHKRKIILHGEETWVGGKLTYGEERFKVFTGDETKEPYIITDENEIKEQNIDPDKILNVPMEYKENFENDIYIAIRDIAGIATKAMYRFFTNLPKLLPMFNGKNWVDRDIIKVSFFNNDSIISLLDKNLIRNRRSPSKPIYIHIDIGYASDLTGISGCHIENFIKVERKNPISGNVVYSYEPVVIQDFAFAISRYPGEETPIFKIRDFIVDLVSAGVPIGAVSTDGFQSVMLRQELMSKGFTVELISVDKTLDAYVKLKTCVYENRFFGVCNNVLINELKGLRVVGKKVDHQPGGNSEKPGLAGYGKDIADATAGSLQLALSRAKNYSLQNTLNDDMFNRLFCADFNDSVIDRAIEEELKFLNLN